MPKGSKDKQRNFVVTQWNVDVEERDYKRLMKLHEIRFLAYGKEVCPDTQRPHHQLFLYFKNPRSTKTSGLNAIGNIFGPIHCRVAPMRGSFAENEAYCSKESALVKLGKEPKQGARGDLDELVAQVAAGEVTCDTLTLENPAIIHQYGRTLEKAQAIGLRKKFRKWMTEGIWICGPSGVGKSRKAFEGFNPDTHFVKVLDDQWWDGYTGQETVIFNEFRGDHMSIHALFGLVDRYPLQVKQRCKEPVPFLAKKVIITCSRHPKDVYAHALGEGGESWKQFDRRFKVIEMTEQPQLLRQLAELRPAACFPSALARERTLVPNTPPTIVEDTDEEELPFEDSQ